MADNTFLGLQPYTEDDAYRFKGRTGESQELFKMIVRNDFTVCYAESGEGKTSLLNAGVFPLLRENMYFPIAITFTSDDYKVTPDSFDAIINRCIKDSIAEYNEKNKGVNVEYQLCSTDFQGSDSQAELQRELSKYSWWKLRNYKPQAMGLIFTPVFVFDQFEEVFNLPGSIVWTKKFFDWLEDVSSDSCPDEIVKKIREIIGDKAAFPTIKEEKGFKALFSLRKEFIGELDYWGMQIHFIPALKDNHYFLKALTYEGAMKVMTQQKSFDESKVEKVLNYFVKKYSREPERTIVEDLPAIPALLLSVVGNSWEKNSQYFLEDNNDCIEHSLSNILEQFYDSTIEIIIHDLVREWKEKSIKKAQNSPWYGVQGLDEDFYRRQIEEILFLLVDRNGKRERTKTTSSRFSQFGFDDNYKKVLSDNHIIKVSKIDGEDYVEIVHDCLCPVIIKRKEARFAVEAKEREERLLREIERANRLKEQREELISSFANASLAIILSIFLSRLFHSIELVRNMRLFDITSILVLANITIVPILIYSAVKRFKTTLWLSIYGIISNTILLFYFIKGQETEMGIRLGLSAVILGIPLMSLIYAIKVELNRNQFLREWKRIITSIPILLFFEIVAGSVFYLCVFNKALGLSEPFNSSWAVIVIPLLAHGIIRSSFGQRQNMIVFFVLCFLLGLLTYNTSVVPFALPSYAVICILGMTMGIITWLFWGLTWGKRTIAILLDFIILFFVVVLNMGFNVSKVKYDSVSHVFNWVDVLVHDNENHFGVVSACSGDTILPCAFDSIDYRKHYCFLSSNKISYVKDVSDNKGQYTYKRSTNTAVWKCLFNDEIENRITKKKSLTSNTKREDSIRVYAARVYHEVRNANIQYFTTGESYSLKNVKTIDTLVVLQNKELKDILNEFSNSSSSVLSKPLTITQVIAFNKAFARSFYLCMLQDRILQKDSVNLFNLTQEIITLYFYDAGEYELTINSNSNFIIGSFRKTYSSTIKASELRKNTLDSWYNYVNMLLGFDMGTNAEVYVNTKEMRYSEILKNVKNINRRTTSFLEKISQKGNKLELSDLKNVMDIYMQNKEESKEQIGKIEIEKRHMDLNYQKLINDVFVALSNVVLNSQNIYNSEFVDICEQLYLISVFRQYEIAPIYLEYLERMDNAKNPTYREFKRMQEREDSLKRMIKESF